MKLGARHRAALDEIFADPVGSNVAWSDVEALLRACGAVIEEGRGSRVRISLNGTRAVFQRPHPAKETEGGLEVDEAVFLIEAGISQ